VISSQLVAGAGVEAAAAADVAAVDPAEAALPLFDPDNT